MPTSASAVPSSAFALPAERAAKVAPALVGDDERHLAAVASSLERSVDDLERRLASARRAPGGEGQHALDRDQEVHRLTARLRALRRVGLDLCLGRMTTTDGDVVYVGRLGLAGEDGARLVVDWRSPAAAPFFAATLADPKGLVSRRRYRWTGGRITDYWDEVLVDDRPGEEASRAALDARSAFVASLGAARTDRMRDALATLAADQDAAVRAGSAGVLVVDGGPGTGKTVVALHRIAYLLHADPRLRAGRGGVLFLGPHQPFLAYVEDVLPDLGEDGVLTATLEDLVPEGAHARPEHDARVATLKADARLVAAVEAAVGLHEEPPTARVAVGTPWADLVVTAADWAEAFGALDPGIPHNEAREAVWEELLGVLVERHGTAEDGEGEAPAAAVRAELARDADLRRTLERAWPMLDAVELVTDLWSVPAYLARYAPHLSREEVLALQRPADAPWTTSDLPLLDAARRRLGDKGLASRQRRREAAAAREQEQRAQVLEELVEAGAADGLMTQLRHADLSERLVDETTLPGGGRRTRSDALAGPFAHVVVDEAQELTDAQWRMVLARCPAGSLTVVGDRAQARHGFAGTWPERLARAGLRRVEVAILTVNYRTPAEVMAEAEPVIRAVLPDAAVPTSVRRTGLPVTHGQVGDLPDLLTSWLADHDEGTACVLAADVETLDLPGTPRVRCLRPDLAKGLEFDLVVLLEPLPGAAEASTAVTAAVDRYVAMTRATQQLVVLTP
ncbi:RNA polymerase recycling motor ATPase HelR [Pseudokineococcus sp. 1T1Z-3]|uniref:RNA polymerase recycling motor ATPase HelR n=1 Tax=Pseudokineococcus sp. 1T1Z-3 TaxID=3132745 RepID=UPI0030AFA754